MPIALPQTAVVDIVLPFLKNKLQQKLIYLKVTLKLGTEPCQTPDLALPLSHLALFQDGKT